MNSWLEGSFAHAILRSVTLPKRLRSVPTVAPSPRTPRRATTSPPPMVGASRSRRASLIPQTVDPRTSQPSGRSTLMSLSSFSSTQPRTTSFGRENLPRKRRGRSIDESNTPTRPPFGPERGRSRPRRQQDRSIGIRRHRCRLADHLLSGLTSEVSSQLSDSLRLASIGLRVIARDPAISAGRRRPEAIS